MSIASELGQLYRRDLTRLLQQLEAFPDDDSLWRRTGTMNSPGNLVLHLEGNLREFIGRQLGDAPYQRKREQEFALTGLSKADLIARVEALRSLVLQTLPAIALDRWSATYPEDVLGTPMSTQMFLIHLSGHLNYHMGQIDCLRRTSSSAPAIQYAGL